MNNLELIKIMENHDYKNLMKEEEVYSISQRCHHTDEDFWDGDLSERIENFSLYRLKLISIDNIDLNEWNVDQDLVDAIIEEIEDDISTMPLPLISDDYSIIDGIHRLNALKELGYMEVFVYLGEN